MYEFTHRGLGLRWNLLDRTSKLLAASSIGASMAAVIPSASIGGDIAYRTGYRIGSGGQLSGYAVRDFTPMMAAWTIVFGVITALLWWRFSLRQDEMFNRVQNWSIAMGAAWTLAATTVWMVLAAAGVAPAVVPIALVIGAAIAMTSFWMVAVRRWA